MGRPANSIRLDQAGRAWMKLDGRVEVGARIFSHLRRRSRGFKSLSLRQPVRDFCVLYRKVENSAHVSAFSQTSSRARLQFLSALKRLSDQGRIYAVHDTGEELMSPAPRWVALPEDSDDGMSAGSRPTPRRPTPSLRPRISALCITARWRPASRGAAIRQIDLRVSDHTASKGSSDILCRVTSASSKELS